MSEIDNCFLKKTKLKRELGSVWTWEGGIAILIDDHRR